MHSIFKHLSLILEKKD